MRPLFEVIVQGGDERAFQALQAAGVSVMGPPYGASGDVIVQAVFALVRAASAEAAAERVQAALPSDGDYSIAATIALDI